MQQLNLNPANPYPETITAPRAGHSSKLPETIPYQDKSPGGGERWNDNHDNRETARTTARTHASGLRQLFPTLIPRKPYCADFLEQGLRIRSRDLALRRRHVQLNGPSSFMWMPHDIDRADAYFAHRDGCLPQPNVIAINPDNGHGHSAILLATPVARHSASRVGPLRFFADVERGFARRLGADRRYPGLILKNPLHPGWRVEWRREEPYTLPELADWLFKRDLASDISPGTTLGAGRNCTVFDELRQIAYREVLAFKRNGSLETFRSRLERVAIGINTQFPLALGMAEIRAIAKSVARWTWRHFSVEKFSALQRHRINIRWRNHISAEKTKPWESLGISRATYYRRKRVGALP
jgi:hypothetical protein